MSSHISVSPAANGHRPSRFGPVLGSTFFASFAWQFFQFLHACARDIDAPGPWLGLAGALPFLALTATGGVKLLRGQARGCWLVVAAGVLSLFHWPIPSIPFLDGWLHHRAPFTRLFAVGLNVLLVLLTMLHYRRAKMALELELEPAIPLRGRRLRALLVLVGILTVLAGKFGLTQRLDLESAAMLEQGNEAFEAGRQEEAMVLWRQLIDRYPRTRGWGMALFNTSLVYRQRKQWAEAIPLLEELLASDLNDTDPTRYLMSPYQNYHHEACLGLMDCYESQKDYPAALRYARLARDVYPYRSWCGTCLSESRRSLSRTTARLELIIGGAHTPTAEALQALAGGGEVLCFTFAPDDRSVIFGTSHGMIRIWELEGEATARSVVLEGLPDLSALAFSPDGKTGAGWGQDGTVTVWTVADGRQRLVVSRQTGKGHSLAFSPDGRTLAGGGEGVVVLWDAATGQRQTSLAEDAGWHKPLAFSPDGRSLAYGISNDSLDHPIKLWDLEAGKARATFHRDSSAMYALAFSPDGTILACANQRGGLVEWWDVKAARQFPPLSGHTHNTIAVAFSPDGQTLASAGMDGAIKVWDVASGQERFSLDLKSRVDCLAFTGDGKTLASLTHWEQTLQLWDVQTGRLRRTLRGEE